ncbi:MAG: hypothetical protein ACJA0N_002810 [Pseudohongiellaceae bacterium]|jgi:hypothetical protein
MVNTTKTVHYYDQLSQLTDAILRSEKVVDDYCHNYMGGHCQALQNTFPCTLEMMGNKTFSALAQVYIKHYPATNWDINLYGDGFGDFIAAQVMGPKADEFNWLLLAIVSRLEYAITCVYYADNEYSTCDDPFVLATAPTELTIINMDSFTPVMLNSFHPYVDICSVLMFNYPIAVWRSVYRIQIANISGKFD